MRTQYTLGNFSPTPLYSRQPKIYQAGPLFTEGELSYNLQLAVKLRELGFEVFLPQESEQNQKKDYANGIFKSDLAGLDDADIVVAVLDGADVDSGTAWEVGYAFAKGKHVYGIRTDFRIFGPEERINLMVEQCLMEQKAAKTYKELESSLRTELYIFHV